MRQLAAGAAAFFALAAAAAAAPQERSVTLELTAQQTGTVTYKVAADNTRRLVAETFCYQFAQRYRVYDQTVELVGWTDVDGDGVSETTVTFTGVPSPVEEPRGPYAGVEGGYWVPDCTTVVAVAGKLNEPLATWRFLGV